MKINQLLNNPAIMCLFAPITLKIFLMLVVKNSYFQSIKID